MTENNNTTIAVKGRNKRRLDHLKEYLDAPSYDAVISHLFEQSMKAPESMFASRKNRKPFNRDDTWR